VEKIKQALDEDLRKLIREIRELNAAITINDFKKSKLLQSLIDDEMNKDHMCLGSIYENIKTSLYLEAARRFEKGTK